MTIFTLARAARAAISELVPARPPRLFPLLGTLVSADFIRPRPTVRRVVCGHLSMEKRGWSEPFWSTTILLEDGAYVSVDLDPVTPPPTPGQAVSMVGRRRKGLSPEIASMLRPCAKLAKR